MKRRIFPSVDHETPGIYKKNASADEGSGEVSDHARVSRHNYRTIYLDFVWPLNKDIPSCRKCDLTITAHHSERVRVLSDGAFKFLR